MDPEDQAVLLEVAVEGHLERKQVNKKFHKLESVYRDCIKRTRDKTS